MNLYDNKRTSNEGRHQNTRYIIDYSKLQLHSENEACVLTRKQIW